MPRPARNSSVAGPKQVDSQSSKASKKRCHDVEEDVSEIASELRGTTTRPETSPSKGTNPNKVRGATRSLGAFSAVGAAKKSGVKGDALHVSSSEASPPTKSSAPEPGMMWSKDDLMKLMDAVRAECFGAPTLGSKPSCAEDGDYIERLVPYFVFLLISVRAYMQHTAFPKIACLLASDIN